jgi:UDP-N-acetylglucosamine acyltransferase
VNVEGLRRRQFTDAQLKNIRQAYKTIYRSGLRIEDAEIKLAAMEQSSAELDILIEYLSTQEGGIIR